MDETGSMVVITVRGGCVVDVDGLPDGVDYEIRDYDLGDISPEDNGADYIGVDNDGVPYFRGG